MSNIQQGIFREEVSPGSVFLLDWTFLVGYWLLIALMMLATIGCQPTENTSANTLHQVDPTLVIERGQIRFIADSTIGRQLAVQQGLPCLLFFTAEWCTFCHQMEATTLADRAIGKLAEKFVCVLVDADREPAVCHQFQVRGYPTVQFLSADGRPLQQLVGRQPPAQLAAVMQSALERTAWLDSTDGHRR